jgi:ribonuclease P protein component
MLPKANRLSTTYEFNKTRRLGKRVSSPLFDLFYLDFHNYDGPTRVGVVVTNKYSKVAPVRNRVKRVFREVVRLNLKKFKDGYWVVIHPRKSAEEKGYEEVNAQFTKILSKVPFTN